MGRTLFYIMENEFQDVRTYHVSLCRVRHETATFENMKITHISADHRETIIKED